ncbi:MAG: AI-2E family transporter [Planctomycetaceae bacterium]
MTRMVSLGVILGLVVVFGLLSLRVMAAFLLPLLLAAMLVVIFGPLHRWLRDRFQLPEWAAAALTTLFVLLIVLVPLALLVARAGGDAARMVRSPDGMRLDPAVLDGLVVKFNDATGLHITAESVNAELAKIAEEGVAPVVKRAPVVVAKLLIGLVVMTVSLFYFLADGRRMLEAAMRLVPLDVRYQWQLLREFEEVSRAVVSSTLLAAIVQAVLAGFGFSVAGLGNVFLLTLLTFFGALVPFVGAAAVWGSASLYLLFFVKNTWAAAGLALWGLCVVSTVDNIIKPIVLHGQSKLHPLLALLSVLGGVGALGPIGIFVGPIAVAFLQAALTMLQVELDAMKGGGWTAAIAAGPEAAGTPPGAGVASEGDGRVKS